MRSKVTALIAEGSGVYAFEPFVLVPDGQLLLENGTPIKVGRRAFPILLALLERQGEVVGKRDLMAVAWPDTVVDEGNLKVNIASLRQILGDDALVPRFIATVAGRGYRFIGAARYSMAQHPMLSASHPRARRHDLPVTGKRVLGRREAIDAILNDLEISRLVTIVGAGGIGKTTVAVAAANEAAATFKDGVRFIDFTSMARSSEIAEEIGRAVGFDNRSSASLSDHLRHLNMLIVLDNCEHLLDEIATCIDKILRSARSVRLLTTSREALNVRGERVRRLPGLGLPALSATISAVEALGSPGVELFVECASEAHPAFMLDDGNAAVVVELCHRLDGHALAIESVAARVGSLGVSGLLDHLARRFHMFDGYHVGPHRHRTLTSTIDSSYHLLTDVEQSLMRRLSVFTSEFGLDEARAVSGIDAAQIALLQNGIASLVAKSLLVAERRGSDMYYRLTNIVRLYSEQKLLEHGETAAVLQLLDDDQ